MTELQKNDEQVMTRSLSLATKAQTLAVTCDEEYNAAADQLKDAKALRKEIVTHFQDMKAKAYDAHQTVCRKEKKALDPCDGVITLIGSKMGVYERARAEAARVVAERARREAEEQAMAEAKALEDAGLNEAAERRIEDPVPPPAKAPPPAAPKVAGIVPKRPWTFTITDEAQIDRLYCKPDPVKIRAAIKLHHKKAEEMVGGIEVYQDYTRAVR